MRKEMCIRECGGRLRRLYERVQSGQKTTWTKTNYWRCEKCHRVWQEDDHGWLDPYLWGALPLWGPLLALITTWLLSLWAAGLGARLSLELLLADQFITIPNYAVNIYFDFLPLCVMGLVVAVLTTRALLKRRYA